MNQLIKMHTGRQDKEKLQLYYLHTVETQNKKQKINSESIKHHYNKQLIILKLVTFIGSNGGSEYWCFQQGKDRQLGKTTPTAVGEIIRP